MLLSPKVAFIVRTTGYLDAVRPTIIYTMYLDLANYSIYKLRLGTSLSVYIYNSKAINRRPNTVTKNMVSN